jgi:hypothetical protein
VTAVYSAELWDGNYLTYASLGLAPAADEAEAIQKAQQWAKALDNIPAGAWLRVNVGGVMSSFRLGEF